MSFVTSRNALGLLTAVLACAPLNFAAGISGTVKGPDGAPFKAAFVQAQNSKTKITVSVLSDRDGRYHVDNLPAGDYTLRIRAVAYKADPKTGVTLSASQNAAFDWQLQTGTVHWNDLSLYQGEKLLPNLPGKEMMFGPSAVNRDAPCQICHGFQSRMASTRRDEEGWHSRVQYMRETMGFSLARVTDTEADRMASYMNALFGENSVLPPSPASMPEYKSLVKTFDDDALNIVYVEYDLPGPNRMPWSAAPDKAGNVWMPYYGKANMIGRLDPETGAIKEFPVPAQGTAAVHSVYPAPDGSVWLAEFGLNKLGRWDPKTEAITEYPDAFPPPQEGGRRGSKHTVRIGPDGMAWSSGYPVSRFDPKTGKFDHFEEATYGVVVDKDGNCWFTEYSAAGKIGMIDGKTLKVKTWTPPASSNKQVYSRRIQVDSDGMVWFSESEGDQIGRFDPKTETFKQFPLPGPKATPYAMNLGKDREIWYSSEYTDVVGRLDPATGKVTEYPFPHAENTMREFWLDSQGHMWFATPANNKVGYFYLAKK